MPELPEVESTVKRIRAGIIGQSVRSVWIGWPRSIERPAPKEFQKRITGAVFQAVHRRGKYIVMTYLSAGRNGKNVEKYLLCHLRVYGRAGKPCRRCHSEIAKILVAQRGTHICQQCQKNGYFH